MSIWSKIGKFLYEAFATPEDKVNYLSQAVVTACKTGVSDDQALQILRLAAERQFTLQAQVNLFKMKLWEKGGRMGIERVIEDVAGQSGPGVNQPEVDQPEKTWRKLSSQEEVSLYVVAIGNTILNLLGEDTMSYRYKSVLTEEDNKRIRQSCELQRARINPSSLDQEALRDALWQCFGRKSAWKIIDHPCWEMCRITDLEIWSRDEWHRTHPMPSS
jgi:hypothetical protein